jgi:hypothetical protein
MIKREFGDSVRSKLDVAMRDEDLAKVHGWRGMEPMTG